MTIEDLAIQKEKAKIIILSPELENVSKIFSSTAHGRLFSIFQHPVEITIQKYHYLTHHNVIPYLSIEQFVSSYHFHDNIITRSLLGESSKNEKLTYDHVVFAKKILRQKCLVGLQNQVEDFVYRLTRYFQWKNLDSQKEECIREIVLNQNKENDDIMMQYPGKGSKEWKMIEKRNEFDLMIFDYMQELFQDEENIHYKVKRHHAIYSKEIIP